MTPETILLRQVHPHFAPNGELTSQAFYPFPKDEGKLSVYDGDQISPRESFEHYADVMQKESVGVWGVSNAEVSDVGLDSANTPLPNSPAHAHIDFEERNEKSCRRLAKRLKSAALDRGCLFSSQLPKTP